MLTKDAVSSCILLLTKISYTYLYKKHSCFKLALIDTVIEMRSIICKQFTPNLMHWYSLVLIGTHWYSLVLIRNMFIFIAAVIYMFFLQ